MDTENNPDNNYNNASDAYKVNIDEFKKNNPNPTIQLSETVNLKPEDTTKVTNSPSQFVLQWLTYAFWGWTVVAMSFVVVTMLTFFMNSADLGYATLYGTAAVLVLLPISIVCDIFYSKHEPEKKAGASSVVMVIHAVIFALSTIGSLISVVWSLVTLFISLNDTTAAQISLYSSLIIAFLFAFVFFRTILPGKLFWLRRYFLILMTTIVGVLILISFLGPVMGARLTMVDKLIESNLSEVKYSIDNYAEKNNKLPDSLRDISITGDAKKIVDDELVKYTKDFESDYERRSYGDQVFYYQLCVTYKKASNERYSSYSSSDDSDGYEEYLSAYSHPEGLVCYKLKNTVYSD